MRRQIVLASRSAHKARELTGLLAPFEVVTLPDDIALPPETGTTFAENAGLKARAVAEALGVAVVADDSGIEAQALDGRPGVHSARYAGPDASDEENLAKLVAEAPAGSALAYVCALVHVGADGAETLVVERCTGTMAADTRGGEGFGYDPVFVPDDIPGGRTMAELHPGEKASISHRGRAARALLARLPG